MPGMVGNVTFESGAASDSEDKLIILPSQAVVLGNDNRTFVWVVKNGKAERKYVTADVIVADGVAVKEGLVPGDSVIVEGMQKVSTGIKVEALVK